MQLDKRYYQCESEQRKKLTVEQREGNSQSHTEVTKRPL
jgi:hypothetical protein